MAVEDTRGYCDDGDTIVGLDGHAAVVFTAGTNSPIQITPWARLSTALLEGDGDVQRLVVVGEHTRNSRGDAEWYAYQKALALSAQGIITIGTKDHSAQTRTFSGCWFEAASFEISADAAVRYTFTFARGEPERGTAEPAYDADKLQAAIADYGKSTNHTFTANGYALGDWAVLLPIVRRPVLTAHIGRCYGSRITDIRTGRHVGLEVQAVIMKNSQILFQDAITDMVAGVTTGSIEIVGNGNTFTACQLTDVRSGQHEHRYGEVTLSFAQEIDS